MLVVLTSFLVQFLQHVVSKFAVSSVSVVLSTWFDVCRMMSVTFPSFTDADSVPGTMKRLILFVKINCRKSFMHSFYSVPLITW